MPESFPKSITGPERAPVDLLRWNFAIRKWKGVDFRPYRPPGDGDEHGQKERGNGDGEEREERARAQEK